jgi:hypothetical protein
VPQAQAGTTPLPYVDRTAGLQTYFGNLHSHTSYSDGVSTPTAAYTYARTQAQTPLDFLAVTDHNHGQAGPMTPSLYQQGLAEAAAATVDGEFVALYGQEWGIAAAGHVNIFESPVLFGWEPGRYDVFVAQDDYTGLYAAIAANPSSWGALASFCHPGDGDFNGFAFTAPGAAVMRGIALINGPALSTATDESDVGNTGFDPQYLTALRRGFTVSPVGDQDNHEANWGASTETRTAILASALTKSDLLAGLAARRTYATQDHNVQVAMQVNGWPMGSQLLAGEGNLALRFYPALVRLFPAGLGALALGLLALGEGGDLLQAGLRRRARFAGRAQGQAQFGQLRQRFPQAAAQVLGPASLGRDGRPNQHAKKQRGPHGNDQDRVQCAQLREDFLSVHGFWLSLPSNRGGSLAARWIRPQTS